MSAPEIHAVTFDAGGTLIEPSPSVGHIYAGVAARFGVSGISAEILDQRFAAAWQQLKSFDYTRTEWARLVDDTFAGLTDTPPSQTFFPEIYSQFATPAAWRIYEDVQPTLDALASRQLKLAVVSNWDDRLRPLLAQLHLDRYFEAVVVSCEVGFCKPSPVIFEQAAQKLGLAPRNILHVGDSLETDVRGARAAGFSVTHLQRGANGLREGQINSLHLLIREINKTE